MVILGIGAAPGGPGGPETVCQNALVLTLLTLLQVARLEKGEKKPQGVEANGSWSPLTPMMWHKTQNDANPDDSNPSFFVELDNAFQATQEKIAGDFESLLKSATDITT